MKKIFPSNTADAIGIFSSGICFLHCVAGPLLLVTGISIFALPALKYIFITTAFVSIYYSLQRQELLRVALFQWTCFWTLLFSLFFADAYPWLEYTGRIASLLIIAGHIWNIRSCKRCAENKENRMDVK